MANGKPGRPKGIPKTGGRQRGTLNVKTISKELAREEARRYIQRHMPRMITAQVESACGLGHLLLRNDDGTFTRAPEKMTADEMLKVLNGDPNRYYLATKDPNTQAFTIMAAYALDKPKEQAIDINITDKVGERLDAAREAARRRNAERKGEK